MRDHRWPSLRIFAALVLVIFEKMCAEVPLNTFTILVRVETYQRVNMVGHDFHFFYCNLI
jgi:hypothetical protein